VNPVVGRARDVGGAVSPARESIYPTVLDLPSQCVGDDFGWPALDAETVSAEGMDQFGDGRRSLLRQVHGEHITKFDSAETYSIHCQTVTRP
jgi:hypothetical protein